MEPTAHQPLPPLRIAKKVRTQISFVYIKHATTYCDILAGCFHTNVDFLTHYHCLFSFQARRTETSPNANTRSPLQARPRVTALQTTCRPHATGHPCECPKLEEHTPLFQYYMIQRSTVEHPLFIPANLSLLLYRTTLI